MRRSLKRWRPRTAGLLTLAALGVALLLWAGAFNRRHRPTVGEFHSLEYGMTPAQVEAIMGPPHKVITSESKGLTKEQEFYKPHTPGLIVYYYVGAQEEPETAQDMVDPIV